MKTILVPVEESEALPAILEAALHVARRFGAHIEGRCVSLAYPEVIHAFGVESPALIESFNKESAEHIHRARARFHEFMEARGVRRSTGVGPASEPTAGCEEEVVPSYAAFGAIGRLFDLIVAGRPTKGVEQPSFAAVENALFESGRPVLIAPPKSLDIIGETVVIAWNGSVEAARTTALAMPILARAAKVEVLTVRDGMVPGPSGAEARHHLLRNGIEANATQVSKDERPVGQIILETAGELGADLLVKGAFTHGRVRQIIFGGATQHILDEATLPVLMAH
ncbi:MAG: universal stress protein [Rhodospirillales bacterium]|jgi:nucleotide-binding universal stress UspA family protein|nr:universal stress protein [Rhodospirillales bacterium]